MVSFTGSVETGSRVMAAAATNITKVNLELGGKAPAIVLADADVRSRREGDPRLAVINSGQVCNCAERVYVQRKIAADVREKLVAAMRETTYGDPLAATSPSDGAARQRERRLRQGRSPRSDGAVEAGARASSPAASSSSRAAGSYFEPTVITETAARTWTSCSARSSARSLPIHVVDSLDEAIEKANDSVYGLTSSIYTNDIAPPCARATSSVRRDLHQSRELRGHAGLPRRASASSGIGGADGKHGLYEYTTSHMVYLQT